MGNVFALLSAEPGKAQELLDALATYPGVTQRQLLFGEQVAVRFDEGHLDDCRGLAWLTSVREARVYHHGEAWMLKTAPPRLGAAPPKDPVP